MIAPPSILETRWGGEELIVLSAGGFEARLVPALGGILISLTQETYGLSILRCPPDPAKLRERPMAWGIPVLFPPNRIRDGIMIAGDKRYELPLNTRDRNHCHGLLCRLPWETSDRRTEGATAEIEIAFIARSGTEYFRMFPHEFEFRIRYGLSSEGLTQNLLVRNDGADPMPLGVGFHTAFNVPFSLDGDADACRLNVSVGRRWELDERILPTGRLFPPDDRCAQYRTSGIKPAGADMEEHYTADPLRGSGGRAFNGAVLSDSSMNLSIRYETGPSFRHWMIWNGRNEPGFICAEPMSWMIDAPNLPLPPELTGFRMLAPGDSFRERSRISVEPGTGLRFPDGSSDLAALDAPAKLDTAFR